MGPLSSLPPELLTVSLMVCGPSEFKRAEYVAARPLPTPLHAQVVTWPLVLAVQRMFEPPSVLSLGCDCEFTSVRGEQVTLLILGGGGPDGSTVTVAEASSSPPALLAVSVTVYVPSRLKLGLYVDLEPLLGEPPLALHEYVSIAPPRLRETRHVTTLSPSSIEDGEQLILMSGGSTPPFTVTGKLALSESPSGSVADTVIVAVPELTAVIE